MVRRRCAEEVQSRSRGCAELKGSEVVQRWCIVRWSRVRWCNGGAEVCNGVQWCKGAQRCAEVLSGSCRGSAVMVMKCR